jgi:excisionase family DNA binding protein
LQAGGQWFDTAIFQAGTQPDVVKLKKVRSPKASLLLANDPSPTEAAKLLKTNRRTLMRNVEAKTVPAYQIEGHSGKQWRIPRAYINAQLGIGLTPYQLQLEQWVADMRGSARYGKPLSEKTINDQNLYGIGLLWRFSGAKASLQNFTLGIIEQAMVAIPHDIKARNDHFSMRDKLFKACTSFGKHLKRQGLWDELDALKELKPKRRYDPVITTVFKADVKHLLLVNSQLNRAPFDKALTHAIISLLFCTGLRRQELIDLRLEDYNPLARTLTVQAGKGGKGRLLGVSQTLAKDLESWMLWRPNKTAPHLIQIANGKPLNKNVIVKRIGSLAKLAGVKVTAHGFRRGFANLMVESGLGVAEIQELLGHIDVKTTMKYIHLDKRRLTSRMADVEF